MTTERSEARQSGLSILMTETAIRGLTDLMRDRKLPGAPEGLQSIARRFEQLIESGKVKIEYDESAIPFEYGHHVFYEEEKVLLVLKVNPELGAALLSVGDLEKAELFVSFVETVIGVVGRYRELLGYGVPLITQKEASRFLKKR